MQTRPDPVSLFGIRHHGPGSARSLRDALHRLEPDCILIEGPPDAQALIPLAGHVDMVPPVALLVYRTDDPRRAGFYPYARFSPEWVALQIALTHAVPVQFIDLPQTHQLADGFAATHAIVPEDSDIAMPATEDRRDPLGVLAAASGYDDAERWWDDLVESRAIVGVDVFAAIAEAMNTLRESAPARSPEDARRESFREAHMRAAIRAALKAGHERIAVVCGAWHVPALQIYAAKGQVAADAAILKGLAKTRTEAAWIPWSYARLATASGYRAGVLSPEWYDAVWHHGERVAIAWLARAAALMRAEDLDASAAGVIEAARLATMLAALRGRSRPALDDLDSAVEATLCFANPAPMRMIREKLVIGERLGTIPADGPQTPLQRDFGAQTKRLRLSPDAAPRLLNLDLRGAMDLARSHFLNRLGLIGVAWARNQQVQGTGTFRESWLLVWRPDFAVALVAASRQGSTIAEAAAAAVRESTAAATRVADLSGLVTVLLDANLPEASVDVIAALNDRAALATDIFDLMEALPPLAELARYGSVRSHDTGPVKAIVGGLVPRIAAGLVAACQSLNEEAAARATAHLDRVQRALGVLDDIALKHDWTVALAALADQAHVQGRIVGRATRFLFDAGAFTAEDAGDRLRLALSRAADAAAAAAWIAGFLDNSGTILMHDKGLLQILDSWLCRLDAEAFLAILPLVRRTFATIVPAERHAIGERLRATGAGALDQAPEPSFDADRAALVLPVLALILGAAPAAGGPP